MFSFLAVIFFTGFIGYYVQETEKTIRDEIINQANILTASESLARYNQEFVSFAQSYILHDSEIDLKRIRYEFSASYGKIIEEMDGLERSGVDRYSLGILRKYSLEVKYDFEKISGLHDRRLALKDHLEIESIEKEERNLLTSIEDIGVKVTGAREMIMEQGRKNMDGAVLLANQQENLSRALLLVAIISGILLSIVVTRSATKQITDLRNGVQKIGQGNLGITLDASSGDEIGELAAAFNKMAEDLKKSTVSVKEMESIVKKRTSETEAKNDTLERFNKMSIGRELKMIELKKRISELEPKASSKKTRN